MDFAVIEHPEALCKVELAWTGYCKISFDAVTARTDVEQVFVVKRSIRSTMLRHKVIDVKRAYTTSPLLSTKAEDATEGKFVT